MVKTLPFQGKGPGVQSLVGELRSHMLCGVAKNEKKKTGTVSLKHISKASMRFTQQKNTIFLHNQMSKSHILQIQRDCLH